MGWLDNLWRRRRPERPPESPVERAHIREEEEEGKKPLTADELEERAHQHRDDAIFREPRVPPGTG